MRDKLKIYLEDMFATVPQTDEVAEVKAELLDGMLERYDDCIAEGMDEQEAYDNVLDSIGDLHELFDELNLNAGNEGKGGEEKHGYSAADLGADLGDFVNNVSNFASGMLSGFFNNAPLGELKLVNTVQLSLENIKNLEISYVNESYSIGTSSDDQLVVREYMNREEPGLLAQVNINGGDVLIKNGQRQGVFGLRSRVEILLPANWHGSLTLSTISGAIESEGVWQLASLTARTVSGEISLNTVDAAMIRLSSTSGAVKVKKATGHMELHSVSGAVKVDEAEGSGSFKTTSGGVRVKFTKLSGHVDASSISGGVRLSIPTEASFEFEGRSVSGNISTGFDSNLTYQRRNKAHGFVGIEPYYHVKASSTSGGIHVND